MIKLKRSQKTKLKTVYEPSYWDKVAENLDAEHIKLASYDHTMLPAMGEVKGRHILDYGSGPGILAKALKERGAVVKALDSSKRMRQLCGQKIGDEHVFKHPTEISDSQFDRIICNLVLCIVGDNEINGILENIRRMLKTDGIAYVGFCNPLIFDVTESQLDLRCSTDNNYFDNHYYEKTKKEGGYKLIELHRPIEWYVTQMFMARLRLRNMLFTPEYNLNGTKIRDFVIFELEAI